MPSWGLFNIPPNIPPGPAPNSFPGTVQYRYSGSPEVKAKYDVHKDYAWTLNNWDIRKYVPKITLTEYKLTQSGELNSFKLSLAAAAESTAGLAVRGAGAGAIVGGVLAGAGAITGAVIGAAAASTAAALNQFAGTGLGTELAVGLNPQLPYEGLYPGKATNNIYVLPYLNVENMTDAAGAAGGWKAVDSELGGAISSLGTGAATLMDDKLGPVLASTLGALNAAAKQAQRVEFALSPGTAVEKIKAFAPKDEGDAINLTFYLSNTTNPADIQANWSFLYKLTSQNLPLRRSINLLDPPCVYDVEVPGFKRFPIAVIESLKVTNEGTTRYVDITTGEMQEGGIGGNNAKLIPEAYKVTITIRSLLQNTRNLFSYAGGSEYNRVNVFAPPGAGSISPLNLPGKTQ